MAKSTLPDLPAGKKAGDVDTTIHSHPTDLMETNNRIYPQSASTPSDGDVPTFRQFNTNIIVGPLGSGKNIFTKPDGTQSIPNRSNGIVIYQTNKDNIELTKKAIERILSN